MQWGFFTLTHIVSLLFVAVFILAMHYGLKRLSRRTQTVILGSLSFLGILAVIYNLLAWDSPLEYLPLHLCSLTAMVLPVVVFTRNKALGNTLLVWCLGAVAALVMNNAMATAELLSWPFFFYYFPHMVEFAIPVLLISLGHVKKDPKCILSTIAITMGIYTLVHFANLGINAYCAANNVCSPSGEVIFVNYMYSLAPNNPLVALFQKIIPGTYWHMYLIVPILLVYLVIVYAPELIKYFKNKKCVV